jgi:outer membrane receptor protein involved in Fe transport
MRVRNAFIYSTVSMAALAMATPALAQATSPAETIPEKTAEGEQLPPSSEPTNAEGQVAAETPPTDTGGTIVVTGSRIRRNNFTTPQNVDILTRDDQILSGTRSTTEALQSGTVTSGTSQIGASFIGFLSEGGQAANVVGLRGLGSQRTLVLLNGRRLAPAGAGPQLVSADLNVLPTAVVQRIEILREGASSIYGSDAIAGVINIITDTKLDGITVDAFADVPTYANGGQTYRLSLTGGKTFDRGYITAAFEYREDKGLRQGDRKDMSCPRELAFVNGEEVGQHVAIGSDELRCFPIGPRNNLGIAQGYALTRGIRLNPLRFVGTPRLIPNDDLSQLPYAITGFDDRPTADAIIGPLLKSHLFSPIKTFTGFLSGAYEIDALGDAEIYGEGLFTRRKSHQDGAQSFTYQRVTNNGPDVYEAQLYFGNIAGVAPCEALFGSQCSPFAPTAWADLGINYFGPLIPLQQLSTQRQKVDFFRGNAGIRGNLNLGDWRYDANVMISRTRAKDTIHDALTESVNNSIVAVIAPAGTPGQYITPALPGQVGFGNNYTCASNVTDGAYNGGTCYAVNLFDPNVVKRGVLPQAFYDYVFTDAVGKTKYNQETFSISFDGSLFQLPGGTAKGALGFEHRRDSIDDVPSVERQQGLLNGFGTAGRTKGSDKVTEAFAEVQLPILADRPFVDLLEVDGSARWTHYKSYGSDVTYALSAQWAPIENIRFRGNYGTNFRAPNLYEQFIADQIGFYGATVDPCDGFAAVSQPGDTLYQNCLAALTPILGADAVNFETSGGSVQVTTTGGKDVLKAETAKTWGVGVVLSAPKHIADLSLAIDYFNIEVKGEVATLGNLLLNFCYESEDFPNAPECAFIGPREPDEGQVSAGQLTTLQNPYLNIARQQVRGIDFDARYATSLFGGRFQTQLQATRNLKQATENFEGGGLNDFNGQLGYPGAGAGPKWVGSLDTRFTTANDITFRWGVKYVGKAEDPQPPFGLTEAGNTCTLDTAGCFEAEYDLTAERYWEHGASVQWLWKDVGQFTIGVNNIFNQDPPTISSFPNGSSPRLGNFFGNGPYDYRGRSFFVNVTRSFK